MRQKDQLLLLHLLYNKNNHNPLSLFTGSFLPPLPLHPCISYFFSIFNTPPHTLPIPPPPFQTNFSINPPHTQTNSADFDALSIWFYMFEDGKPPVILLLPKITTLLLFISGFFGF